VTFQKSIDKACRRYSVHRIMAGDHYTEYNGKGFLLLSLVLTFLFWAAFTWLLLPFVPAETPILVYGFAGFTAACLSGVFFLATHMFQLVLAAQRKDARGRGA
jgi:hypothetical protein